MFLWNIIAISGLGNIPNTVTVLISSKVVLLLSLSRVTNSPRNKMRDDFVLTFHKNIQSGMLWPHANEIPA